MISRTHQTLSSHIERENTKMIKMKGPMCCVACEVKNMLWRSKKKSNQCERRRSWSINMLCEHTEWTAKDKVYYLSETSPRSLNEEIEEMENFLLFLPSHLSPLYFSISRFSDFSAHWAQLSPLLCHITLRSHHCCLSRRSWNRKTEREEKQTNKLLIHVRFGYIEAVFFEWLQCATKQWDELYVVALGYEWAVWKWILFCCFNSIHVCWARKF